MPASFVVLPFKARSGGQVMFAERRCLCDRPAAAARAGAAGVVGRRRRPVRRTAAEAIHSNRVMPSASLRLTGVVSELRDDETAPTPIAVVSGPFGMNGHGWA